MTRINITEQDEYTGRVKVVGWFDDDTGEAFGEDTRWDGSNHISVNTGSQWDHECLYHTAGGRWVIHAWSQWQGSLDSYRFVDDDDARDWLLLNEHDDDVQRLFGTLEPERGPGRPEIGPPTPVRLPEEMIGRLDEIASQRGTSRAAVIRDIIGEYLAAS